MREIAGVGSTTRDRILATADRLNFSASHLASSLASEVLIPAGLRVELINLVDSDELETGSPKFQTLMRQLDSGRGRDALMFAGTVSIERDKSHQESAHLPAVASGSPLTGAAGDRRCPQQISIAAFDGHPMSTSWGLTTVDQHAHRQGQRAAYALVAELDGLDAGAPVDETDLRVELLVRETTSAPAR